MAGMRSVCPNADLLAQLAADARLRDPDALVLLPTRRACTRLKALFPEGFLPNIMPLGALDETWLAQLALQSGKADALRAIAPAADVAQAQLQLARALEREYQRLAKPPQHLEQFLAMARAIWEVFDAVESDGKPLDALAKLSKGDLSDHWRERVQMVRFAADWWAGYARTYAVQSPIARRNQLAEWLADYWRAHAPTAPVIIAGSTGSQASTLRLMHAVQALELGEVWLQHGPATAALAPTPECSGRIEALLAAFEQTKPAALPNGVSALSALDEQEEAALAALLAQEALQTPDAQVAILVHDAQNVRRLCAALDAAQLPYDSAMAQDVSQLNAVRFWRLLLRARAQPTDPTIWLALMKATGLQPTAERLELAWLRGRQKSAPIAAPIAAQLVRWAERAQTPDAERADISAWLGALQPLLEMLEQADATAMLRAQLAAFDALPLSPSEQERELLASLTSTMAQLGTLDWLAFSQITEQLLSQQQVFAVPNMQARIRIYSPMEARLMRADRVILCGLNEGQWPRAAAVHPWLHPFLAAQLDLPPPERAIALSAHDFVTLNGVGAEVFWLRPARAGGVDQLPSRWLERFEIPEHTAPELQWLRQSSVVALMAESPAAWASVPLAARPQTFSITALTQLLRDPYGYYAKYILKLRALEPIGRPADAALRGQLVHLVMQRWVEALNDGASLERATYDDIVREVLAQEPEPIVRYQWGPRLYAMADAVVALEHERRAKNTRISAEETLSICVADCQIEGRADRVERSAQEASIIDYKVGTPPALKDVNLGFEPQLPLLAAMLEQPEHAKELAYWKLSGVGGKLEAKSLNVDAQEVMDFYIQGLSMLFEFYAKADARYFICPQPDAAPRYNDYALLQRQSA